jgi:3-oxo-5-alpha-steroid 4-dehydrogenase 1
MSEAEFFPILLGCFFGIGASIFVVLFFIPAPYGRHTRSGWGPKMNSKWGWLAMEAPAAVLFLLFFYMGNRRDLVPIIFLFVWLSHYFHRAFIYPFSLRSRKSLPVLVMFLALFFNVINAYLQARWIYSLAPETFYTKKWLTDSRFLIGICLFYTGFMIAKGADNILRNLRKPGETGYKIPNQGFFRFVSCPNYLGEIIQWIGWAVAVWSWPGLVFALWTAFNLLPRARSHHLWYQKTFTDYPAGRKALIPLVF